MAGNVMTIFVSVIPIIEIVFIVLLIREIFGIGYKKAGSNAEGRDIAAGWWKDTFGKSEKKIEDDEAEIKKLDHDENKIQEEEKQKERELIEIQRLINSLTIQGNDLLDRLNHGHTQLVNVSNNPHFADITINITNNILVPMNADATDLKSNAENLRLKTRLQLQELRSMKQSLNREKDTLPIINKKRLEKEKDLVNKIKTEGEQIERKKYVLESHKNGTGGTLSGVTIDELEAEFNLLVKDHKKSQDELKLLRARMKSEEERAKQRLIQISEALNSISDDVFDERKLMRLESSSINPGITEILKEINELSIYLTSIHNHKVKTNISANDVANLMKEKQEKYDQKLIKLKENINSVGQGYSQLSIHSANMSGLVVKLNKLTGARRGEMNIGSTNELTAKPTTMG